jgi:transposase
LIHAIVHAADIQDRDGGVFVMATTFGMYPFLMKLYADGGYQGPLFRRAVAKIMARVNVEIVKRSDHAKGFVALPKRWVVERTFAWLGGAGVSPGIKRISFARRAHFCASLQSGSC